MDCFALNFHCNFTLRNYFNDMGKKNKFFGKRDKIKEIFENLKAEKISESGTFFKRHNVKGIGTKTFYDISSGKKEFSLDTFEKIAKCFTKELRSQGEKNKIVTTSELIKNPVDNSNIIKITLWTIESATDLSNVINDNYEIFNHTEPTEEVVEELEIFYKNLFSHDDRKIDKADKFIATITDLKRNSRINTSIKKLKKKGVSVHHGEAKLPLLSVYSEVKNYDEGIYKYKAIIKLSLVSIFLISNSDEKDPEIIFKPKFTLNEMRETIEQNPFVHEGKNETWDALNNLIWAYYDQKLGKHFPVKLLDIPFEWKKNKEGFNNPSVEHIGDDEKNLLEKIKKAKEASMDLDMMVRVKEEEIKQMQTYLKKLEKKNKALDKVKEKKDSVG